MVGNRLPFPIRVRSEINLVNLLGGVFQFLKNFSFSPDSDVLRCKVILNINTKLFLGKILEMAHRGLNNKILANYFFQRVDFSR